MLLLAPLWKLLCALRGRWERLFPPRSPSGPWGESWAAWFLRSQGCRIIGRNLRPYRRGELDILAKAGDVWLFVEVKTRRNEAYGRPLLAINHTKRLHLRRCATRWLAQHNLLQLGVRYRFEAIEVIGRPGCGRPILRRISPLDLSRTPAPERFL